jgi:hypothetical protein
MPLTLSPSTENYLALYTNYSNPHVAVGQREIADDDDADDALPYRAAVLGEDEEETTPNALEILSHTKRGRTRLEALRNLLAHLEHRAAEGIDMREGKTRKKEEKEKAAAVAKEINEKSMTKKGAVKKGRVTKAPAKKATAQKFTAWTEKALTQAIGREQGARTKSRRTKEVEEDPDATDSAHENADIIEVAVVARGQKTAPGKTVPKQTKIKRTQVDDDEGDDEESDQPSKKQKSREVPVEKIKNGDVIVDEVREPEPRKPKAKPLNRQALLRKQRKDAKAVMQIEEED